MAAAHSWATVETTLSMPLLNMQHQFQPHPLLKNKHAMTIASTFWPRRFTLTAKSSEKRIFQVDSENRISSWCHWQPDRQTRATLVIVHGLESSSQSRHILGMVEKALAYGMNAIRLNLRTCDDDYTLSKSLYNCGMSGDIKSVIHELIEVDQLSNIFLAGFSLGGNIVLKAAGELADRCSPHLAGVCAISPAIDPSACVQQLQEGFNQVYQARFLSSLSKRVKAKCKVDPGTLRVELLKQVRTIHDFDEFFTAPDSGYLDADDYYSRASALPLLPKITIPSLIIQAQDDPFIPASIFNSPYLNNPNIQLIITRYGGHCAFIQKQKEVSEVFDFFWAENRAIEFCHLHDHPACHQALQAIK